MTDREAIATLKELDGKATPGPWVIRTLENFGWNVVEYVGGDRFNIKRVSKCGQEPDAALIVALRNDALRIITRQEAEIEQKDVEIARLRKLVQPSWFYHPDQMEMCLWSPHEVVDEMYDPTPGKYVFEVECATALPSIWCAVHCLTDEEQEAMVTDDRFILTEHASEEEARAALENRNDR